MNLHSSRHNYGTLPLTGAVLAALQLEFAMVESPAPRARFLNFPFADEAEKETTLRRAPVAPRDLAA